VGQALAEYLGSEHQILISDPGYPEHAHPLPADLDALIVCVATPGTELGECDASAVFSVLSTVSAAVPCMIKSTISVQVWHRLVSEFPQLDLVYSPEFLTAQNARSDLLTSTVTLVGGVNPEFWSQVFPNQLVVADPQVLIFSKLFRNAFLATKVSFFNQVQDLCVAADVDPVSVIDLVVLDSRIGSSHSVVTPERGFGGACLPKDLQALLFCADVLGVQLPVLRSVAQYNQQIRGDK
jgi:nucleotide sugar dehydrogenase